jgi:hypothetical protein
VCIALKAAHKHCGHTTTKVAQHRILLNRSSGEEAGFMKLTLRDQGLRQHEMCIGTHLIETKPFCGSYEVSA